MILNIEVTLKPWQIEKQKIIANPSYLFWDYEISTTGTSDPGTKRNFTIMEGILIPGQFPLAALMQHFQGMGCRQNNVDLLQLYEDILTQGYNWKVKSVSARLNDLRELGWVSFSRNYNQMLTDEALKIDIKKIIDDIIENQSNLDLSGQVDASRIMKYFAANG